MTQPVVFVWKEVEIVHKDGEIGRHFVMVPRLRYANICKRQYVVDEEYPLAVAEQRSMASHNQYFAALNDGFKNLPEAISYKRTRKGEFVLDDGGNRIPMWPNVEYLRAWLLIQTGHCDVKEIECHSESHVTRLTTFVRANVKYARVSRSGLTVIIRTPVSQSRASMKKEEFQQSKADVLGLLEQMIGVPLGTLMKEAGRSA